MNHSKLQLRKKEELYKMEYGGNEAVMGFEIEFDRHKST